MSDSIESLRRKIDGAADLESVVRTMKALAASNIGQYEKAVQSLVDYYHTVELGLLVRLKQEKVTVNIIKHKQPSIINVIAFGSDQGLVGQFNDILADFVIKTLTTLPGKKKLWVVGERINGRLEDSKLDIKGIFSVPNSVNAISPLVSQLLIDSETKADTNEVIPLYIFHNRPITEAVYEPVSQKLLPLDAGWQLQLTKLKWPTGNLPEVVGGMEQTLKSLVAEYLFVSLFKACAESLASENASRLAAMQRAEKNIDELLEDISLNYHRLRQRTIDEELFDVISGFEAMKVKH